MALKYHEDKFPKKNQTAAWVNQVNNVQSFENILDPSVAYSVFSGDVSIDMEGTNEVPKLEQNSFDTFESSLRSVCSDTHLLPNRNSPSPLEDQRENMVSTKTKEIHATYQSPFFVTSCPGPKKVRFLAKN